MATEKLKQYAFINYIHYINIAFKITSKTFKIKCFFTENTYYKI